MGVGARTLAPASADRWPTWVLLVVLVDFLRYCYHCTAHRVRLVWAAHQAHHSSEYFNFSTATRRSGTSGSRR